MYIHLEIETSSVSVLNYFSNKKFQSAYEIKNYYVYVVTKFII